MMDQPVPNLPPNPNFNANPMPNNQAGPIPLDAINNIGRRREIAPYLTELSGVRQIYRTVCGRRGKIVVNPVRTGGYHHPLLLCCGPDWDRSRAFEEEEE